MEKPTVIDLFSGCGGFALGAQLAGFHVSHAVEIDSNLHYSFPLNFPNSTTHLRDIRTLNKSYWNSVLGNKKPDAVIGGPPCQGFSDIGRRQTNDKRNKLVAEFFKQVEILQPRFFIMENVKGILREHAKNLLQKELDKVSTQYKILEPLVLNASKFSIPTSRERVFVVGINTSEMNNVDILQLQKTNNRPVTVWDAISDLPKVCTYKSKKDNYDWKGYRKSAVDNNLSYAKSMRRLPRCGVGWVTSKTQVRNGKVSGNYKTLHTDVVQYRFKNTRQGSVEKVSRYPRLQASGFCPTLRAGTGSDHGSYQAMRPIHPTQPRVISVREAARLQSFPDWFVFHPTIWHSFRMIGNSVPPMLAKIILRNFRYCL